MLILKSLHLADLCLPPVIQCSVLDIVQELVHIIHQHAPSTSVSRARLLLPWGQRSNRGKELNISEWKDEDFLFLSTNLMYFWRFWGGAKSSTLLFVFCFWHVDISGGKLGLQMQLFFLFYRIVKMEPSQWQAVRNEETVSYNTWFSFTYKLL